MLLLDEILQRGFEGDVILVGFAEHFRNLLLSKDERMAQLLDVPEEHKRVYFEKAGIIAAPYILSALSILNEAELGFKTALNKRLHLELALIRLCYLNDLLELSPVSAEDATLKKKQPEAGSYNEGIRAAPAAAPPPATPAYVAPAIVPQQVEEPGKSPEVKPVPVPPAVPSFKEPVSATAATTIEASRVAKKPKLGRNFLQEIHELTGQEAVQEPPLQLSQELAEQLFIAFKDYVRHEKRQMQAAEQLNIMQVKYISATELQLVCMTEINLLFGQNQREPFLDFGKSKTRISDLRVTVILDPSAETEAPRDRVLSKLEIYDLAAADNPALKALKESLDLRVE